jgi:hypothetical protein
MQRATSAVGISGLLLLVFATSGCGPSHMRTVPLLANAGAPITETPLRTIPLEVVTRSTAVADPFPVSGSDVAYSDLEHAMGSAVSSATAEWATLTPPKRAGGYQLFVELVAARAAYKDGRLLVSFDVRATLHTRVSGDFVAQSIGHCRQGTLVEVEKGAPVVYSCMMQIGRDLSAWLGRLDL